MTIRSRIISFKADRITGWAYNVDTPEAQVSLQLKIDGQIVRRIICNQFRDDISPIEFPSQKIGFGTSIPLNFWTGRSVAVSMVEESSDEIIKEADVATENVRLDDKHGSTIFGAITSAEFERIAGWVTNFEEILDVELEIDGILIDVQKANNLVMIDEKRMAGFSFRRFPHHIYDGAEHIVKILARSSTLVEVGKATILFPREAAPRFSGEIQTAAHGRLKGTAFYPDDPERVAEIALLIDGVERIRTVSQAGTGDFTFDLTSLDVRDWLQAEVVVLNTDGNIQLRYLGSHPIRDSLFAEIQISTVGVPSLLVQAPVPLPALIHAEVEAQDGSMNRIDINNLDGADKIIVQVGGSAPPPNPRIFINKIVFNGGEATSSTSPIQVDEQEGREVGNFVDPTVARVRLALTQRVRDVAGDPGGVGYSGSWIFEPPAEIRGWALDLADMRPLVVALTIDGEVAALSYAKDGVVVREAGFRFETPTGFRFDLASFASMGGSRQIDVCVMPGHRPLNGRPTYVDFNTLEAIAYREARVDRLVREGVLAEAYLAARAALQGSRAGVAERFQILDFVLRTEWRNYNEVLTAVENNLGEPLLNRLRNAASGLESELPTESNFGLPSIYHDLLAFKARSRSQKVASPPSDQERVERVALWKTLQALPAKSTFKPKHKSVAIVIAHGPAQPLYENFYEAAAEAGCKVIRIYHLGGASISAETLAEMHEAEVAVVLRAPRIFGLAAIAYWPALITSRSGFMKVNGTKILSGNSHDPDCEFSGYFEDEAVSILSIKNNPCLQNVLAGTNESSEGVLQVPVFEIVRPEDLFQTDGPIVLHESGSTHLLPNIPSYFRTFLIPDTSATTLSSALADLKNEASRNQLVIVLDKAFAYPADYIEEIYRKYVLSGEMASIVEALVSYDPMKQRFYFSQVNKQKKVFLGHIALGGYRLGDLIDCFTSYGIGESTVVATAVPFFYIPSDEPVIKGNFLLASRKHFKKENTNLVELQKGFVGHIYVTWTGSFKEIPHGRIELDDAVAAIAALTHALAIAVKGNAVEGFFTKVSAVAQVGRPDVARNALRDFVIARANAGHIDETELKQTIELAKGLGLRQEIVRHLGTRSLFSLGGNAEIIVPLFETFAVILPSDQVAAAVTTATALILKTPSNKALYRIADVTRRYCGGEVATIVVNMIASAGQTKIFAEEHFASIIGECLIGSDICATSFISDRYGLDYFVSRASIKSKIRIAIQMLNANQLAVEINQYFSEGLDVSELILLLRTYSNEMTDIRLHEYGIQYPQYADRDQRLALAIMFDDAEEISRNRPVNFANTTVWDSLAILAATYRHDFSLLKEAFSTWAGGLNLMTPDFSGVTIHSFFENMLSGNKDLKTASQDHGKVSVIVTVYNPDLLLLELALKSIIDQSYPNIELILIDDASDDTPAQDIAQMANLDPRILFMRMPKNVGPYVCRNEALKISSGAFIAIQDGDDFSHPQRIEKQVEALVTSPIYQMCTTSHLRIDRRARLQLEHDLSLLGDGTMTSMFRRQVFDVLGPFIRVRSRGDVEFRQRILKSYGAHTAIHIEAPMVFCYATPSSLSNRVARNLHEYLVAFRSSIDKTLAAPVLYGRRDVKRCIDVEVPWPMRPL